MNSDGGMSGNIGAAGRAGAGGLGTGGGAGSRAGKGGAGSGGTSGNAEPCDSGTVSGTRARELVAQGALLLDVRTASEFARGNLAGAINIPLDELPDRLGELPKDKTIVTYCSSGSRASQAADLLRRQGFTVCNLGPMSAW
jgi:rhodanese-related sulfurtransferase